MSLIFKTQDEITGNKQDEVMYDSNIFHSFSPCIEICIGPHKTIIWRRNIFHATKVVPLYDKKFA